MKAKGNNILVRPDKKDLKLKSGVILPHEVDRDKEWGEVLQGCGKIKTGQRVLYYGKHCFTHNDEKIVDIKRVVIWK